MLGKIYSVIFLLVIIASLWYQRIYLQESAVEFNAQRMAENAVLPTLTSTQYNSFSFEDGFLTSTFSGKNMVYYSDKHFEATQDLVYHEIDTSAKKQSTLNSKDFVLKTSKATGQVVAVEPDAGQTLMSKNKLKFVLMPNIVDFYFGDNVGQTSDVYFDAIQRTLSSDKHIQSKGPSGRIQAVGFIYKINIGEITLNSNVDGMIFPSKIPKN